VVEDDFNGAETLIERLEELTIVRVRKRHRRQSRAAASVPPLAAAMNPWWSTVWILVRVEGVNS